MVLGRCSATEHRPAGPGTSAPRVAVTVSAPEASSSRLARPRRLHSTTELARSFVSRSRASSATARLVLRRAQNLLVGVGGRCSGPPHVTEAHSDLPGIREEEAGTASGRTRPRRHVLGRISGSAPSASHAARFRSRGAVRIGGAGGEGARCVRECCGVVGRTRGVPWVHAGVAGSLVWCWPWGSGG